MQSALKDGTYDQNQYTELLEGQLKREEQIVKIAKKQHDKDRAELRYANVKTEISRINKDKSEQIDIKKFKSDILNALNTHKDVDIEEMMKNSFSKDDLESLVSNLDLK